MFKYRQGSTLAEKTRWQIAYLLDKTPWFCWAHLVTWALWRSNPLRECAAQSAKCRQEGQTFEGCYCHKFCAGQAGGCEMCIGMAKQGTHK